MTPEAPRPSSDTSRRMPLPVASIRTWQLLAPAWRTMLVTASRRAKARALSSAGVKSSGISEPAGAVKATSAASRAIRARASSARRSSAR